jgi:hypothetical protein
VVGYRAWMVVGDTLVSIGKGRQTWEREEHARCRLGHRHRAPARECECGLYAYHRLQDAILHSQYAGSELVIGAVELWGDMEVYPEGVRAGSARIIALMGPPAPAHYGAPGATGPTYVLRSGPRRAERAARRYGVPVLPREALVRYANEGRGAVPGSLMPSRGPLPHELRRGWPSAIGAGVATLGAGAALSGLLDGGGWLETTFWSAALAINLLSLLLVARYARVR